MDVSRFGAKFLGHSGILQLMDDLGQAAQIPGVRMLGGGNPAQIPQVHAVLRQAMERVLDSDSAFERMVGYYSGPEGDAAYREALARLFREECGWDVGPEHIALTNSSQTAFFYLFNLFAGTGPDGVSRRILLPLAPEYIGYGDVGIEPEIFVSHRPQIEHLPERQFKYHVDFERLQVTEEIGAICVSRPTNPTGNVLTQEELSQLSHLARHHGIPLIVDNAYGAPFPEIIYTDPGLPWAPHMVLTMSLSKLGMPGVRTGIVVARPEIVRAVAAMNAILSLAPGNFGPALTLELVRSREVLRLCREVIRPHYRAKAEHALACIHQSLAGTDYHVHRPEGAFFVWLWFRNLPITAQELYQRLKEQGVVVVPGQHFFPGLAEEWRHKQECIRVSYAADPEVVREGFRIIGQEVRRAYGG